MTRTPFPPGFFDRADESSDDRFYAVDRLLTHIDDGAIAAVTELYDELGLTGEVLASVHRGSRTSRRRRSGWSPSA